MRARSALLAATCALTVAIAPGPGATAAGTGEFCGPGWQKTGSPAVRRFSSFTDVDGAAGDVWAVGAHHRYRGRDASLAARWDGASWTETPTVDPGIATRFEGVTWVSREDAWAVGSTEVPDTRLLAERWDGASWTSVPMPDVAGGLDELWAVDAAAADDVWAVGNRGASTTRTVVAHWNGTAWSIEASPSPGGAINALYGVHAVSAGEAWAFGVTGDTTEDVDPLLLRWNGSAWSAVPQDASAPAGMYLEDGGVAADGDVWTAGGAWRLTGGPTGIAQHRQGTTWTTWPSAGPRWTGIAPAGDTDVWLAGESETGAPTAHWDGTSWSAIATPPGRGTNASPNLRAIEAPTPDEIWTVGSVVVPGGATTPGATTLAMRLCPLDVTDIGFSKESSRVNQGSGTLWRFPASNQGSHDVTEALGLGGGTSPLFATGPRPPGATGTFRLDHAGTFPVVDTTTGHAAELTVPTEALPKKAALGTTFTIYTSALTTLPPSLGTDIRYRKPGSEFWYRLVSGRTGGATPFTPDQKGVHTIQARLKNKVTGVTSGWSPFATINVTVP